MSLGQLGFAFCRFVAKCTQDQRNLNWTDEFLHHEEKTNIGRLLQNKCFLVGCENTADEEQTKKCAALRQF